MKQKYSEAFIEQAVVKLHPRGTRTVREVALDLNVSYNLEHRHSAIRFVTPHERHAGQDTALLSKRVDVYEAAKAKHPQRWSGPTRNWQPVQVVHLNPDQRVDGKKEEHQQLRKTA